MNIFFHSGRVLLLLLPLVAHAQPNAEVKRWQEQASRVTIIRDEWGIPHIYGKTDADAVFGLLYAQCEDDFARVEMNYIEKLGRKAEVYGDKEIYADLFTRLVIDSAAAVADFKKSPPWLKKLCQAFADGVNFYLFKNPHIKPALLARFEPWYPLLWTDGSIGAVKTADVTVDELKAFYTGTDYPIANRFTLFEENTLGSNGFAIGPARTASGKAILYINPHVTFYFRPEVHLVSEEGLNAYGAVTWGQFFIYQGFNETCGWMHTSCNVDVADLYREKISSQQNRLVYEYAGRQRLVQQRPVTVAFKTTNGRQHKTFTAYSTHHGPVMAKREGHHISVKAVNRSLTGLIQSWQRTKARGLRDFEQTMTLRSNASNSTLFADNAGNIAFWHGNFVPRRSGEFDWSKPVDGTTAATEWKGLHPVEETVHTINPASGWIQHCNSTPFTAAGESSPWRENYPAYMAPDGENFRGLNAARILSRESGLTVDGVIQAGYDKTLAAFEWLTPALLRAYAQLPATDSLRALLAEPLAVLQTWNYTVSENSVATTLAVEWAQRLTAALRKVYVEAGEEDQVQVVKKFAATAEPRTLLEPLYHTVQDLKKRFGAWGIAWGEVNRFQRISGSLENTFDDAQPSFPVAFAPATWGMLPSYNSRTFSNTRKRYGVSGNSFVCAVEFGERVRARSLLAGGNSGNLQSPHFFDQGEMYASGTFKEVWFYKEDVLKNAKRQYRPGE